MLWDFFSDAPLLYEMLKENNTLDTNTCLEINYQWND